MSKQIPLTIIFSKDLAGKQIIVSNLDVSEKCEFTMDMTDFELQINNKSKIQIKDCFFIDNKGIIIEFDNKKFQYKFLHNETPKEETQDITKALTSERSNKRSLYYDAYDLKYLSSNSCRRDILLQYYDSTYIKNPNQNPFLDSLIVKALKGTETHGGLPIGASSFLNTDVTYFATGLSRFLAERTKDELNEMFFSRMKKELNKYPELGIIFPLTTQVLNTIETYGYASIIQILRDAFENDLRVLPQNIYKLKDAEYYCYLISDKDDEKQCKERRKKLEAFYKSDNGKWLQLGLFTMNETFEGTNPANILKNIAKSAELKSLKDTLKKDEFNILSFIELGNIISQSLISCEKNQIWITPQQFDDFVNDTGVFKIYLGLLLAQEQKKDATEKIYFYKKDSKISFEKLLKDNHNNIDNLKKLIKNSYAVYNKSNESFKQIREANENGKNADPVVLYNYYRTLTNSIIPVAQSIGNLTNNEIYLKQYEKIAKFLNASVDLVTQIKTQQYTLAISSAVILLSEISINNETKTEFKPIINAFTKYGTLIANVANAQSSDEVKKAIEASALPVGSSAMKRNSNFSIFLNAYVGGYYGQNFAWKNDTIKSFGLYAPIGISLNWGFCSQKDDGALSLTFNVLELGSLVNIYLRDGDNAIIADDFKVRLVDLISPGVQLSYLFPKTPLTIFTGINYIPKFYPQQDKTYKGGWRWQVGLAVDIPMYKLHINGN